MAKSKDGVTKLAPGRWELRVTWRDVAGVKRDTTRVVKADTKLEAMGKRAQFAEDLAGVSAEWTLKHAVDEWLKSLRGHTQRTRTGILKPLVERWGERKLSHISTPEWQRWIATLPGKDETANVYRAAVKALYSFAKSKGALMGPNTVESTTRRHTSKSNDEWVAELEAEPERHALIGDEVPRFFEALEAAEPELAPLVRMQLLLGCRWAEAVALQWRDVDWDTGVITIRRNQTAHGEIGPTKGKRRRVAALGREGLAFLRGHRAVMERSRWPGWERWMFPRPLLGQPRGKHDMWVPSTSYRRVSEVLESLGIELASVNHMPRHTHVTIARALESDAAMRASVGHAREKETERYTDESRRATVAQQYAADLEEKLSGVVSGSVPSIGAGGPKSGPVSLRPMKSKGK